MRVRAGSTAAVDHGNMAEDDPAPESVDPNREWAIHGILGQEEIDIREFFLVEWEPTLEPGTGSKFSIGELPVLPDMQEVPPSRLWVADISKFRHSI